MGHRLRVIARDHLLRSLTPMYLAWLASFILQLRHSGVAEAEARMERLALAFETEKPYLISQWRWPERFRPVKLRR
jgi:glucosylglycerate synthase